MSIPHRHSEYVVREVLSGDRDQPILLADAKAEIVKKFPEYDDRDLERWILDEAAVLGRAVEF